MGATAQDHGLAFGELAVPATAIDDRRPLRLDPAGGPCGDPPGELSVDPLLPVGESRREGLGVEARTAKALAETVLIDRAVLVDATGLIGAPLEVRIPERVPHPDPSATGRRQRDPEQERRDGKPCGRG